MWGRAQTRTPWFKLLWRKAGLVLLYKRCGWSSLLTASARVACVSAGPGRCLALSPLQAAAAGPH